MTTDWQGDNPFCLVIRPDVGQPVLVDLDRTGWLKDHADLMRAPGQWILARKAGSEPVCMLHVAEGEQPYYTARVYGTFLPPAGVAGLTEIDLASLKDHAKVKIYGIGKKRRDGQVDRMWVLPNGCVCGGDDDGPLADQLAKVKLAALLQERINGPDHGRITGPGEEADPGAAGQAREEGGGRSEAQGAPASEAADDGGGDADGEGRGQGQANAGRGPRGRRRARRRD